MEITVLPIDFCLGEINIVVYPAVIRDRKDMILVDCGYPDSVPKLERELNKIDSSMEDITKIIITHHDHDHMGALKELKDQYPSIEILASKKEIPYLMGTLKSLRLQQAEAIQDSLPDEEKENGKSFQRFIASIKKVNAVTAIHFGETIPLCGGIEVVDTKGHMPGHISLYVPSEKTLISGDALVVENGELCMAMPQFILNRQDAQKSVQRLLSYDIEKIICYHGGIYTKNVKKSIENIVEGFK